MKTVSWNLDIPEKEGFDLIVCGGGIAGCAAALCGARMGRRVLLLEKSTLLDLWENKVLKILTSQWTWMAVGLVLLLIAGYISLNLWYNRSRRRRKVNKRFRL